MSTNDSYVLLFFAVTFFCDIIFFKFYSKKGGNKRLKLCEKKIGHHTRL